METAVDVRNLRKVFNVSQRADAGLWAAVRSLVHRETKEVVAVSGVSFRIPTGEIRALIGPNGAGKSTVMKVLSGILHPTSGEVSCLGVTPWRHRTEYVRQIGAIFGQKSQLLWDLPPVDTFALNQQIYRIPQNRYRENLDYFITSFHLEPIIGTPVRNLSLGERMKCELAAAMLHDPALLFLDEPTIGLDILAKEALRDLVTKVNADRKVTVVLTTHDLDDVQHLSQHVTLISKGSKVFDGSLTSLRQHESPERQLELRFGRVVTEGELSEWKVLDHQGVTCLVGVDRENLPEQVAQLLAKLPVQDIEMKSPDLESIIKHIYLDDDHPARIIESAHV